MSETESTIAEDRDLDADALLHWVMKISEEFERMLPAQQPADAGRNFGFAVMTMERMVMVVLRRAGVEADSERIQGAITDLCTELLEEYAEGADAALH